MSSRPSGNIPYIQDRLDFRERLRRTFYVLSRLRMGVAAGIAVIVIILVAVLAPVIMPQDPFGGEIIDRLKPPVWDPQGSTEHILGTDGVGRDVLSRLIYASRISLGVGIVASLGAGLVGILLGLASGYLGKGVDVVISMVINIMLTFPFVLLALAVIAVMGGGIVNLVLVLAISGWPVFARVVRTQVMNIKEQEYVQAARVVGTNDWCIVFRHIFPNLLNSIIILISTQVARMIISEAFLSFLGLGIMPPIPTWGNMLGEARNYMYDKWWLPTFPGVAIFITTLAINLLGDALRDYLDPHSSSY